MVLKQTNDTSKIRLTYLLEDNNVVWRGVVVLFGDELSKVCEARHIFFAPGNACNKARSLVALRSA